jgi:D-beta-D-heptose 7-phosphate kinase/D-beta-D-heptose 1-phosphate adenosyltransferase
LECVDHVIVFDQDTPHHLLECLRPDVLVKGGTTETIVGKEVVEAYGGDVYTTETSMAASTTQIVSKLREMADTNQPSTA